MSQPQTAQPQFVEAMSDTNYDVLSSLTNTLEEVDALNTYIDDAQQCGEQDLVDVFTRLRDDSLTHVTLPRDTIVRHCKDGKFC